MSIKKLYEMLRIKKNRMPFPQMTCLSNYLSYQDYLKYISYLLVLLMVLYEVCAQLPLMSHPGSEGVIDSENAILWLLLEVISVSRFLKIWLD